MSKTVDRFIDIMDLINKSDTPLTTEQIANSVGVSIRTAQRHAMKLANLKIVGIKCIETKRYYDYTYKETGQVLKISRKSFGYQYFKL